MSDVITADGTRLRLYEQGPRDAPVVVLVHGLSLSARSWDRVAEPLAERFRVVRYDLRGHGHSGDAAGGDYSLDRHADDLGAVLEHVLDEEERAVVVGNSLGGGVIVLHAHRSGTERLGAVVFAGSGASSLTLPGFPASDLPDVVAAGLNIVWLQVLRVLGVLAKVFRPVQPVSDAVVRRLAFTPEASEEVVARVRDDFMTTRYRAMVRTTLASMRRDGMEYAASLTVPALVLHGTGDPEVSTAEDRELVERLPHASLEQVSGAGHMLPLTDPDAVVEQVSRWADAHGAARPGRG